MIDPTKTAAFPSLDAWKRTQQAREDELNRLYKRVLGDIRDQSAQGRDTFVLHLDGTYYQVETVGSLWWRKLIPVGRLKRLVELFTADGFTVTVDHCNSNLILSWKLDA